MIRKVFAEKFNGIIWRMLIHEEKDLLAVESRNLESKKPSYSVINTANGDMLFKEKQFLEEADSHLAHISEENLLLKLSNRSDSLESTGLISIDLKSGKIIWEKYNIALQATCDEAISVFDTRFYPRKFYWIDIKNAVKIPESQSAKNSNSEIIFPNLNLNFEFPEFINARNYEGAVYELMQNDLKIISYHEKNEDKLNQKIIVYNDKEIVLEEYLIRNIQKLQPESFFVLKNQLFYVRNKDEIVSYFV